MDEVKRGLQVHIDHHIPLLLAHAHHQAIAGNAGIVDQYVDPAEVLDDLGDHLGGVLEIGGIGGISLSFDAERLQLFFCVLEILIRLQVGKGYRSPFLSELHRNRLADTACSTGNHGNFSFK